MCVCVCVEEQGATGIQPNAKIQDAFHPDTLSMQKSGRNIMCTSQKTATKRFYRATYLSYTAAITLTLPLGAKDNNIPYVLHKIRIVPLIS